MTFLRYIWQRVRRRKHISIDDTGTELRRCLTLSRLIFIGVGKTIGVGIYVLIGVATQQAGPGVILSFLVGFLVTLLNALCFAEYASKCPKTGAQYTYMYETIGEGVAFIVGWTNCIGITAAFSLAARGWSGYLDSLFDHQIENFTESHIAHWTHGPPIPEYPDISAIGLVLIVMVVVSLGVNFASTINTVLSTVSVSVLVFIVICGLFYANLDNWLNNGVGFFPNGFNGVLKAAASCFYAYQGFEILGYSTEETTDPKKNIPKSIVCTLLIVTAVYLTVAVSFTLMTPFSEIDTKAPFPSAFAYHSIIWAKYLVAIGPVLALSNLNMLELFTLQRISYSMASDGLLFKCLSRVNQYTKVPIGPVLVFGPIVIILILLIDLSNLIGFMVIYTFLQYSLFSGYLIILRYNKQTVAVEIHNVDEAFHEIVDTTVTETSRILTSENEIAPTPNDFEMKRKEHAAEESEHSFLKTDMVDDMEDDTATKTHKFCDFFNGVSGRISVTQLVVLIYLLTILLTLDLIHGPSNSIYTIVAILILGAPILFAAFLIWCRKQKGNRRGFLVPLMPFLPAACLFCNLVMLFSVVDTGSATATAVMTLIGAIIYLFLMVIDYLRMRKGDVRSLDESQQLLQRMEEDTEFD